MRQYSSVYTPVHRSASHGHQSRFCGSGGSFARGKQTESVGSMAPAMQQRPSPAYSECVDLRCMDKIDEETLRMLIVELELNKPRELPELRVVNVAQDLMLSVQGPER